MDQCCASPDFPVIDIRNDARAQKLRKALHSLYYGQMAIVVIKFLIYGGVAGIFQLVNLWVVWTAYATLHFCSCLIYLIMCSFDMLFTLMDWQRYEDTSAAKKQEPSDMIRFLLIVQIVYYVVAIFYTYRAYNHFKLLFLVQVGEMREPLDSSGDHDQEAMYQQQQRQMREQFYHRQQQR